jgi:hypothetical protein
MHAMDQADIDGAKDDKHLAGMRCGLRATAGSCPSATAGSSYHLVCSICIEEHLSYIIDCSKIAHDMIISSSSISSSHCGTHYHIMSTQ